MSTDYNDVSVGVIYTNKSIILAERIDSRGRGGIFAVRKLSKSQSNH